MTREEQSALGSLIQIVEAAIASGDWVVDGACDLERVLAAGKRAITRASRCGNTTAPRPTALEALEQAFDHHWSSNSVDCDDNAR